MTVRALERARVERLPVIVTIESMPDIKIHATVDRVDLRRRVGVTAEYSAVCRDAGAVIIVPDTNVYPDGWEDEDAEN